MKRIFVLVFISLFIITSFSGCEEQASKLSDEEIQEAAIACSRAYSAMSSASAGVSIQTIGNQTVVSFTNVDISSASDSYETVSGTMTVDSSGTSATINYDFTLTGGPVKSISYSIDLSNMGSIGDGSFTITMTVNGDDYEM